MKLHRYLMYTLFIQNYAEYPREKAYQLLHLAALCLVYRVFAKSILLFLFSLVFALRARHIGLELIAASHSMATK